MLPKCIVIAGPTACGKTSLSVEMALVLGGEVINADSMQVYRGMDIGTAKPTAFEQKGVPHHLLDVVDPDEEFNAAIYRTLALTLAREIVSRRRACLVTGGTGLYIKSLTQGLFDCPPADPEFRDSLRKECDALGIMPLYKRLKQTDPESAARIHPNDKVRIMRALEIAHLTHGRPSELIRGHNFSGAELNAMKICLDVERDALYDRINRRCIGMVEAGLAEETQRLLSKGYSPNLKSMSSIGYRHMIHHLQGEWSLDQAVSKMQQDTRRYAKRQLTWFKADPEYVWVRPEDFDGILGMVKAFLNGN